MTDIKTLNDNFRRTFTGGQVLLTVGIDSLPTAEVMQILRKIRDFADFTPDNDLYEEHETSLSFAREE